MSDSIIGTSLLPFMLGGNYVQIGATSIAVPVQIVHVGGSNAGEDYPSLLAATIPDIYIVRVGLPPIIYSNSDNTLFDLAATDSAFSAGGIIHIVNEIYRLDVSDSAFNQNAIINITGANSTRKVMAHPIEVGQLPISPTIVEAGTVIWRSLVTPSGKFIEIVRNRDYNTTTNQYGEWTDTTGNWPTLTGGTITVSFRKKDEHGDADDSSPPDASFPGVIYVGSGDSKVVRLYMTRAQTATLEAGIRNYRFYIDATLSNGDTTQLIRGDLTVLEEGV